MLVIHMVLLWPSGGQPATWHASQSVSQYQPLPRSIGSLDRVHHPMKGWSCHHVMKVMLAHPATIFSWQVGGRGTHRSVGGKRSYPFAQLADVTFRRRAMRAAKTRANVTCVPLAKSWPSAHLLIAHLLLTYGVTFVPFAKSWSSTHSLAADAPIHDYMAGRATT